MSDAEPSSDPIQLLPPRRTVNSETAFYAPLSPLSTGSQLSEAVAHVGAAVPVPYVQVAQLAPSERVVYHELAELELTSDHELYNFTPHSVVGEFRQGSVLWYFARDKVGPAHKFKAAEFAKQYPTLAKDFQRRKMDGTLPSFNPNGPDVHPQSRVKMTIAFTELQRQVKQQNLVRAGPSRIPFDNEGEEWDNDIAEGSSPTRVEDSEAESEDEDEDESDFLVGSRVTRGTTKATATNKRFTRRGQLPFSPRKTRSKNVVINVDSDDEDGSPVETAQALRRSSRATTNRRKTLADDDYQSDNSDDSESQFEAHSRRSRKGEATQPKKVRRGKEARPAYGHFRLVADLDYDPYEDEDTVALRAHRDICQKCQRKPTHLLLLKPKGRTKKKRADDEDQDSEEDLASLGGWVRCLKCPLSAHWSCLAGTQRNEILKAALQRDRNRWQAEQAANFAEGDDTNVLPEPKRRDSLSAYQTTEFICAMCMKGGVCMGCLDVALEPEDSHSKPNDDNIVPSKVGSKDPEGSPRVTLNDVEMNDVPQVPVGGLSAEEPDDSSSALQKELLFRCSLCRRLAHYAHLPSPDDTAVDDGDLVGRAMIASYYQHENNWTCADCSSYQYTVDNILAWRPFPPNTIEPLRPAGQTPHYKEPLSREYLVKWLDRSYRRTSWVPHGWLLATHAAKLRHFLADGSRIELLKEPVKEDAIANAVAEGGIGVAEESRESSVRLDTVKSAIPLFLGALPDADRRIPPAWKTIDRLLDVKLWSPVRQSSKTKSSKRTAKDAIVISDDEDEDEDDDAVIEARYQRNAAFEDGEPPDEHFMIGIDEFEKTRTMVAEDIGKVVWAFIKWDDLGYDEATWDSPPRSGEPGYEAFEAAFKYLIESRKVTVPLRTKAQYQELDNRKKDGYAHYRLLEGQQPNLGQSEQLKLMPFQIDGFNWLCDNWYNHQSSILADEMGLGKTVQIATFVGKIIAQWKAYPVLIVVPQSTITNWVRELARWAPALRVVPFYGEAKSREIIKRYELKHTRISSGTTGAKFHVLVTTYDNVSNSKDFTPVFKSIARWEVLVVDEGQRLKNDNSLLFKKLNELKIAHRIIMTGTPLNNNIRELFNLMNFLDPDQWNDLEQLEKDHEELTEDLVKQLHERLRPYFLRRVKADVLQLPPKNEVIVPVSMTSLQKEIYKSILSKNLSILMTLTRSLGDSKTRSSSSGVKSNMINILMELRKCIQHPYLVSNDIEPKNLSERESHERLVAASAKLRLLRTLLPKLKARGHRVLLFSQFVIALNLIEDFLIGEDFKYLRLDGSTKQAERQKGMDEFNRPGSDVFIYMLSTRAGGVGINLWSADTVIIFDPDFNPHQDLQAIARSHRYGQTKPCLVFKLMGKDTAEERIMQAGKKKLVLDHVIVQKMDNDEAGEDVKSILTYGAKALFEDDQTARDIIYTDHDVDNLIEKTETEGDQEEAKVPGMTFAFAKVWAADKEGLEEMADEIPESNEPSDSWAQALQRIADERSKVQTNERTGRGVRRKAAVAASMKPQQKYDLEDSPTKDKSKAKKQDRSKSIISDDSDAYMDTFSMASDNEVTDDFTMAMDDVTPKSTQPVHASINGASRLLEPPPQYRTPENQRSVAVQDREQRECGLCGTRHAGPCTMTESSENLAEYRMLLFNQAKDEDIEERRAAIRAIDETLSQRGRIDLIYGQPLQLVEPSPNSAPPVKNGKSRSNQRNPPPITPAHPVKMVDKPTPMRPPSPPPVAGPSRVTSMSSSLKRSATPHDDHTNPKKVKNGKESICPVCMRSPHHLVIDCPVVAEGPASISRAIATLEQHSRHDQTVQMLRNLLKKRKKRESFLSDTTGLSGRT